MRPLGEWILTLLAHRWWPNQSGGGDSLSPAPWAGLEPLEPRILRSATLIDVELLTNLFPQDQAIVVAQLQTDPAAQSAPDAGSDGPLTVAKGALETTESGGSATFTIMLQSEPTADVTIPIRVAEGGEGTLSTDALVFTADNWDIPQTVTVTGRDDAAVDGDSEFLIEIGPAESADPTYDGLDAPDVRVINLDDDTPPGPTLPDPPDDDSDNEPQLPPSDTEPEQPMTTGPPRTADPTIPPADPGINVELPQPPAPESLLPDPFRTPSTPGAGPPEPVEPTVAASPPEPEPDTDTDDDPLTPPVVATAPPTAPPSEAPPIATTTDLDPPEMPAAVATPTAPVAFALAPTQHKALDNASERARESATRLSEQIGFSLAATSGTVGVLAAGQLLWAVRSGSLLSSLLLSLPTWRTVDPIPVLEFARARIDDPDAMPEATSIEDLFQGADAAGRANGGPA